MLDKIRKIVTIVSFFCIITLPLCFFQNPGHSSLVQNKVTAKFPDLSEKSLFDRDTLQQIEQAVDDNIGYKDLATLLYIGANFRIFDNLAISGYERGLADHFLYFTDDILKNYQGFNQPTEESCASVTQQLTEIDRMITQLGGKFFFMPIPNKETVYPEVVPEYIVGSADNGFFARLTDYLEAHSEIAVVPSKHYLTESKHLLQGTDDVLYFKNCDVTHWNAYGMYIGYQALMNTICAWDPSIQKLENTEIVVERTEAPCALLWLQSSKIIQYSFRNVKDFVYTVTPKKGWSYTQDNAEPAEFILANDSQDRYFRMTNSRAKNDKTIFIYGDSYIYSFMLPLLSETFSQVYFLNANVCGATEISDLLQYITPDLFLLERVERMVNLQNFASNMDGVLVALKKLPYAAAIAHLEDKHIDIHFDDPDIEVTHTIEVSKIASNGMVRLTGWAADTQKKAPPLAIVVQIGERIFLGSTVERPDLAQEYYYGGFIVDIPVSDLKGMSEMKLYAITLDAKSSYLPLTVQIQ